MIGFRRALFLLVVLTIALFGQGCASTETPKVKDDITSLKAQVRDLQKRAADLELKVSSQENEIVMMSERLTVSESANNANGHSSLINDKLAAKTKSPIIQFKNLDPAEVYKRSIVFFNQGDYESALNGFSYIVRRYPGATLGPKAQYWIGEVYYSKKRFARAVEEYRKALVRFPKSVKTPDVMLKIGLSRLALGLNEKGEKMLKDLIEKYPESAAAIVAKEKLNEISVVVKQ